MGIAAFWPDCVESGPFLKPENGENSLLFHLDLPIECSKVILSLDPQKVTLYPGAEATMLRGTMMMMVEPKLAVLTPEILAKVGYDVPPSPKALRKDRRRHFEQRDLRDARRSMTYHWF